MISIPEIIGGVFLVFFIGWIIDRLFVSRFISTIFLRVGLSTALAVMIATILYGFANSDDGIWNAGYSYLTYSISGVFVAILRILQLRGQANQ